MDFVYKNVLIFGYGKSGKAVEKVLSDINIGYKIYDKNIKIIGGSFVYKLNVKKLKQFDLIVVSPGISIYNKYIKLAERLNIKVISELEFGYWFTSADIIAVTGTNGKTSTVLALTNLLKNAGFKCEAFGNVGNPLTSAYKQNFDYIVCEVSSFQLETIDRFLAKTTIILNIAPDHIDRHKTLYNYINCKKEILKNCNNDSVIITNSDNEYCKKIVKDVNANIIFFAKNNDKCNLYLKDNKVIVNENEHRKTFLDLKNLKNFYSDNLLAVCAVALQMNLPGESVLEAIKNVEAPHRIETFLKHQGIIYIDDSKGTNIHSCQKAIESVNTNIILMLGGQNKKLKFDDFFKTLPSKVKCIVLFGQSKKVLARCAKKYNIRVIISKSFDDACEKARSQANSGDTILFSPACASFDEFNNYAERGDYFKQLILSKVNCNEEI